MIVGELSPSGVLWYLNEKARSIATDETTDYREQKNRLFHRRPPIRKREKEREREKEVPAI